MEDNSENNLAKGHKENQIANNDNKKKASDNQPKKNMMSESYMLRCILSGQSTVEPSNSQLATLYKKVMEDNKLREENEVQVTELINNIFPTKEIESEIQNQNLKINQFQSKQNWSKKQEQRIKIREILSQKKWSGEFKKNLQLFLRILKEFLSLNKSFLELKFDFLTNDNGSKQQDKEEKIEDNDRELDAQQQKEDEQKIEDNYRELDAQKQKEDEIKKEEEKKQLNNEEFFQMASTFVLLNFNHEANLEYVIAIKNYKKLKFEQISTDQSELLFLMNTLLQIISYEFKISQKKLIVLGFRKQSIISPKDSQTSEDSQIILPEDNQIDTIEFSFTISENIKLTNFEKFQEILENHLESWADGVQVFKKKIFDLLFFNLNTFQEENSRNWIDLKGQVFSRGIKKNERQHYWPPFDYWEGIGIDVSSFSIESVIKSQEKGVKQLQKNDKWLSMDCKEKEAWPIGFLPGCIEDVELLQEKNYVDLFTNKKIEDGIIVYRKQEQIEGLCALIKEPVSKKNYKLGFMCRVNIKRIQCPKQKPDIYVVPSVLDIRPYRFIFKEVI